MKFTKIKFKGKETYINSEYILIVKHNENNQDDEVTLIDGAILTDINQLRFIQLWQG